MKRIFKIFLLSVFSIIIIAGLALGLFVYKVLYGFPVSYETEIPAINFPAEQPAVLLFSKSTGFRHSESIEAGKIAFEDLAKKNNWFLYNTEDGGVFNPEQLSKFSVVVFNNCTGRLLNDAQKKALEDYVQQVGSWIGIHGAGDNSHQWDWYDKNLVGAKYSHHALENQLQEATINLGNMPGSSILKDLTPAWTQTDEWYVFYDSPVANGFNILYSIDGEKINPNGNILFVKDKNFGMGKNHPVAWYKTTGKGLVMYTSIGHDAAAWKQPAFIQLLETAVKQTNAK